VKRLSEGLSCVGVQLNGEIDTAAGSVHRPARPDPPAGSGRGQQLTAALKGMPNVSQVFRPPPLPRQPWWIRPTLRAGCSWIRTRERWTDGTGEP
jgi:hypothetical protein